MATLLSPASVASVAQLPDVKESLSGVFGSISLTAWICLLVRRTPSPGCFAG